MVVYDFGIILEIIGFILLLLVSGRNPTGGYILLENHKDSPFDLMRERIIPNQYVYLALIIGIGLVISGLVLQLSFFV
jgi:hypothetical protein